MNALYELSKLYAQEKISKNEYRRKREELVNAILDGNEPSEYSTTIVPKNTSSDETTQQPANGAKPIAAPKFKHSPPRKTQTPKVSINKPFFAQKTLWMMLIIAVLIFMLVIFIFSLFEQEDPQPSAELTTIQENVDEDPAMHELNTLWESVLVEKKITEQDNQALKSIWASAPENVKARFISDLKETITLWDDDFEREIEAGLTAQLLMTVESYPQ